MPAERLTLIGEAAARQIELSRRAIDRASLAPKNAGSLDTLTVLGRGGDDYRDRPDRTAFVVKRP
ncbi:MAG: hypothetical protein KDJ71_10960 [Nitrobacter sp.]|nr:hypothetical protein [Nitrobacter sp.]